VARIRAFRVSSAGIGSLLGHGCDRVIEIRQRYAQTCALVGGEPREHAGYTPFHDLAVLVELAAALTGQFDEHDTPIGRILESPDESVTRERIDLLGKSGRGHGAALREIAASPRTLPH